MTNAMFSGLTGLVACVLGSVASANPYREPFTAVPKAPHP